MNSQQLNTFLANSAKLNCVLFTLPKKKKIIILQYTCVFTLVILIIPRELNFYLFRLWVKKKKKKSKKKKNKNKNKVMIYF